MSWEHRLPEGVSGLRKTSSGFEAAVSILLDEDGFFGRECPSCTRLFKLREDEWLALPDDPLITCPYCGHHSTDASDFTTTQQRDRALSGAQALAEQYAHEAVRDAFRGFGTRRSRRSRSRGFGIEISVRQSPRPPVRSLLSYVEQEVRRTITCDNCKTHYAVYGATAFCPVCGPRAAAETVLEAIERGRQALALEDALPEDLREQARADGVFDKAAADAIKETVTLFEVFTRDQFGTRVPKHEAITRKSGRGVFQRLDDVDALFAQHVGASISSLVDGGVWVQLQVVFQQRHVLVHQHGIVDEQYVQRVPGAHQQVGQRLVLGRRDAAEALDALEAVVQAVAAHN